MHLRRIHQFLIVYCIGLTGLFLVKYLLNLSNYVIPGPLEVWRTGHRVFTRYLLDVANTLTVAVLGHMLSICMAVVVGIIGRFTHWLGSLIKAAAFNIQAYPVVAVAPIIFILLGDGLSSRLLIAAMICYFPLLLAFMGIVSDPVLHIEHFYRVTHRMNWRLELKIRAFENIKKLVTIVTGSATLAMVGTIVAEFIGADAGIGYSIRIALYQSDLSKILVALLLVGLCTSFYLAVLEWTGHWIQRRWEG